MAWSIHLMWAERAVKYVENKIPYGASNKPIDVYHTSQKGPSPDRPKVPKDMNESVKSIRRFLPTLVQKEGLTDPVDKLRARAQLAAHLGVGNCNEQAAVAFDYLRTVGRETGLACVGFPEHDHVFVVLGLPQKPPDNDKYTFGQGPPASWGDEAVVCDPWYHEWFHVNTDWKRKGERILSTTAPKVRNGDEVKILCLGYA